MLDESPHSCFSPPLKLSGKWLRRGGEKWILRGVSYGPFKPNSRGEPYPEEARLRADLEDIVRLGFNMLRLYELPTVGLLRVATELGLALMCGIPWTDHVDFLRSSTAQRRIRERVIEAVKALREEPCVIGFLVGNEVEKTLVRWMGPQRVQRFLEALIESGRAVAPQKLFSYASYPSTEYLIPANADFLAMNVYLEQPEALAAYLQRLQNLAGNRPLVITEFGLDVALHGEAAQAETRQWFMRACERAAVAGTVWFSYTDEWFRGGQEVTRWQFGLVDAARRGREVSGVQSSVGGRVNSVPRISVIVCTYNGDATLRACLESLQKLRYPDFEVLVIDDGSTRDIGGIAKDFPQVRYVRQEHAGLSVARNLGAALATGEVLAYTDDDCLVDEAWLEHLAGGFDEARWVAAGGPNIPPRPRNRTEAIVAAAPGAPAHVLLSDLEAEHLPGCNLAIRKAALEAIGGFSAAYRVAGDDVDICWRLRAAGGSLRYVPGAMVWHHRRYTVSAYLRQQRGYGHAEALLMRDHPQHFGPLGGARWRGAIYGDHVASPALLEGVIFHGPFGSGLFQGIYLASAQGVLHWMSGVLWAALALVALGLGLYPLAGVLLVLSVFRALSLMQLLPKPFLLNLVEMALLMLLCWAQPMWREAARLMGMIRLGARPSWKPALREVFVPSRPRKVAVGLGEVSFWSETGQGRELLLAEAQRQLDEQGHSVRVDDGWRLFDVEAEPQKDVSPAIITVTEYHGGQRCLTRVRLLLRVRTRALWGSLAGVSILVAWLGWMGLGGVFFAALLLLCLYRQRTQRWVRQSGERAGLSVVG